MKKALFFFCSILVSNLLFSQALVDTTKKWNNALLTEDGDLLCTEFIKFGSDTTVNAITYKKVLRVLNDESGIWQLFGIIRETPDGKIYNKSDSSTPEALLYDFGADVNDTVISKAIRGGDCSVSYFITRPMIVLSVDSINIGGLQRKQLHLAPAGDPPSETDRWIEGIGNSRAGMLHNNFGYVGGNFNLFVCYYEHDTLVYLNPDLPYCIVYTGIGSPDPDETSVSISPDPVFTTAMISLSGKGSDNVLLEIFSGMGNRVRTFTAHDKMVIRKDDFSPGLYFFRFIFQSGKVSTVKVLLM
jgi:hypothetical protein